MSATSGLLKRSQWADVSDGLRRYAALPGWLTAATQPEQVIGVLARIVPEFTSGELILRGCKVKHVGLEDAIGRWTGEYHLMVEGPRPGQKQTVLAQGMLFPPGAVEPIQSLEQTAESRFGADGWRCYLPELRLELEIHPPEPELPALPYLTDPEQARALLEQSIRDGAPAYRDIRIQSCAPEMMRSRAGVRHVLRYRLEYPPDLAAGRGWPALVVAKTYDGDLGQNAYNSMRALWDSPLAASEAVAIAEPLAYLPEPRVLVQGPIQEEQTLEELFESAMRAGTPEALAELQTYLCKAAVGLAALHRSGVTYGRTFTWQDRLAQARGALDGLAGALPQLAEAAAPMLASLEAIAAEEPPDLAVPAHGAFRSAQVLIHQGRIGFIDFDGFCQAEPAMDLARFMATAKDVGLDAVLGKRSADDPATEQLRLQALMQLEALCAAFLAQYEQLAPISRKRIALWEALNIFTLVMSCWKKIKPARLKNTLLMLERHLSASGLYGENDTSTQSQESDVAASLRRLAALPDWLRAALQPDLLLDSLRRHVPEFASGGLALKACKVKRLHMQDASGRWVGTYNLTVEEPETGEKRAVALRGTFTPPALAQPAGDQGSAARGAFGSDGWHCTLPELSLTFDIQPPETALPAMAQLTDPEEARALLERGIRACSPGYQDLRIASCTPEVLSYKPGSRCTIRYHLTYPAELAERGLPATVIAKTYRKESKGRNAYDGMLALWRSPLAAGDVVVIAEPLAYIPELKVLVQGPISEQLTLEDMLKSALDAAAAGSGTAQATEAIERLDHFMRQAAAGLAAFHRSGAHHGETVVLEQRFAEIQDLAARLAISVPDLAGVAAPLLARLEAFAAAHPADPAVPTHGTFNPEQVLIHQGRIGFIDFDDFCLAEPALDVGLFCAAIKDTGMNALDKRAQGNREARLARLAQLDQICEVFQAEYAAHAPISRERVALWEGWSYLRDSLHYWIKVKPAEPDNALLTLEHHLRAMGLYHAPSVEPAAAKPSPAPAVMTFVGGALLSAALLAPAPVFLILLALLAAAGLIGGRAALRQVVGQLDGYPRPQRLIAAGALGFGLSALAATFSLAQLEPLALARFQAVPVHILFLSLFAPAVFAVAAATGGALGHALRSRRAALVLGGAGGLGACLAFLAVDTLLDYLGMHVDTLSAASATLLEVVALDDLGAALVGGALLALLLAHYCAAAADEREAPASLASV